MARKGHLTKPSLFLFPKDVINHALPQGPWAICKVKGASSVAKARFPYAAGSKNELKEDAALHCSLCLEKSPREH